MSDQHDPQGDDANSLPAPTAVAVLEHVVRSIVDDPDAVKVSTGQYRFEPNNFMQLTYNSPITSRLRYDMESYLDYSVGAAGNPAPARMLALPPAV